MSTDFEKTSILIIGGGIFGCAIAYYYTRNNPGKTVIVLERNEFCNSATSRAAALLTIIRSKRSYIPLSLETYHAIASMEKQLGELLNIQRVGMMQVAVSESSLNTLQSSLKIAEEFNQPAYLISNGDAHKLCPWLTTHDVLKVGLFPLEAYCDPYLLGTFYARCAKMQGADMRQGVEAISLIMEGNSVAGVRNYKGMIAAEKTIIATGAWAPLLAAQAGLGLPMAPVRSQYWITEKADLFPVESPMVLLPDAQAYARPEGGALLFGIREKNSFSVSPKNIPADISNYSFSADRGMNDLSEVIQQLVRFFPRVNDIGLKYYIAGFSGYTPDGNLSMGIAPGINNLLLATGCAGAGISVSGGVGLAFAEMAAGKPNPFDFSEFKLDRFGIIDPFSDEWMKKCADARSKKLSG